MGCGVYWQQVHTFEKGIRDIRTGILPWSAEYLGILQSKRAELMGRIGLKLPRILTPLMPFLFLSPEKFQVNLDPEIGYVVVARASPKTPPVYHTVSALEAGAVMRGEITPELKERLLAPVEYYGE